MKLIKQILTVTGMVFAAVALIGGAVAISLARIHDPLWTNHTAEFFFATFTVATTGLACFLTADWLKPAVKGPKS